MKIVRLFILAAVFGSVVCGCKKQNAGTGTAETAGQEGASKEAAMGLTIQWLGHASFRIRHGDSIIYIDPWKLKESPHDATLVLVSHSHHDHYSPEDMAKVSGPDTKLIASADVIAKESAGETIANGLTIELESVRLVGVAAYNPNKQFHPKTNNWVGFVIELGSKRLYYAGDTDLTEEMKALKGIDVALLPVGGTYTMDAAEAAEAAKYMKPGVAIPYHWGDIVGGRDDAEKFADAAECDTKILTPGQTFNAK
jgi:L-ascorbate metabolism protein UlaG (beta-lactamase superfamily)